MTEEEYIEILRSDDFIKLNEALASLFGSIFVVEEHVSGPMASTFLGGIIFQVAQKPEMDVKKFVFEMAQRTTRLNNESEELYQEYPKPSNRARRLMKKALKLHGEAIREAWNMIKWETHFEELLPKPPEKGEFL